VINFKQKKIYIVLLIFIVMIIGTKIFIYDNPKALYVIAEGLDEPSSMYYYVIERIYMLSANESEMNRIIEELESGENEYLHDLYVRTIGAVGKHINRASYVLMKIYVKYQDNKKQKLIVYTVIDSIGFVGNKSTIAILERLLENYENHNMVVAKYPIARSLYLLTGDASKIKEKSSLDFIVTEELKKARQVIANSKDRYRTLDEMLILANLNRPDKFKRGSLREVHK
jgi:hypothetical protein